MIIEFMQSPVFKILTLIWVWSNYCEAIWRDRRWYSWIKMMIDQKWYITYIRWTFWIISKAKLERTFGVFAFLNSIFEGAPKFEDVAWETECLVVISKGYLIKYFLIVLNVYSISGYTTSRIENWWVFRKCFSGYIDA